MARSMFFSLFSYPKGFGAGWENLSRDGDEKQTADSSAALRNDQQKAGRGDLRGADATGEDGVEKSVVAGDLEKAAAVEAGGEAGGGAGFADADAFALDPGGGAGEAIQEPKIG